MIVKVLNESGESNFAVMLPSGEGLSEIVDYVDSTLKVLKATTQSEQYEDVRDDIYNMLDFLSNLLPASSQVEDFYKNLKSENLQTFLLEDQESELN